MRKKRNVPQCQGLVVWTTSVYVPPFANLLLSPFSASLNWLDTHPQGVVAWVFSMTGFMS